MTGPADFGDLEEARTLRERLREKFPKEQVGKLPRTDKRPALDYVGHAAVTDRLNRYAPDWTYTIDKLFDHGGTTYIAGTMTVGGISRVEYGDGKTPKEAIGNFIRRGAMRFGVALDLWSKEELESSPAVHATTKTDRTGSGREGASDAPSVAGDSPVEPEPSSGSRGAASPAEANRKPSTTTSTAGETSDEAGATPGEPASSEPSDTQETHIHGPWADAPRAGFVICQGTRNGKPCGFAEKSKNVSAEQVTT
jgi:hypothetical protein